MAGLSGQECALWSFKAPGSSRLGGAARRTSSSGFNCGTLLADAADAGPSSSYGAVAGGSPLAGERKARPAKGGGQVKKMPNNNKFPRRR